MEGRIAADYIIAGGQKVLVLSANSSGAYPRGSRWRPPQSSISGSPAVVRRCVCTQVRGRGCSIWCAMDAMDALLEFKAVRRWFGPPAFIPGPMLDSRQCRQTAAASTIAPVVERLM